MRWPIDRRRHLLLVALLLPALWLPALPTGPSLATALSEAPDEAKSAQPQPAPPGRKVKLEASETDVPAGRVVKLTARADRSEDEAFVITIRREAGHLGSGLEATCKSKAVCTADVQEGGPSAKRFAAALYRCDQQGVCRLEEDATESDKVRVNWR